MNLRTKSIYPHAGMINSVDIFGYVSHGTPGIEIVGMGKHSRAIKEKFIYLTRVKNLKMPKRRFVLCVEGELEGKKFKDEEYRFLELPMLIMLWSLSGHLPFKNMEDCFSSGKVGIDGEIINLDLNMKIQSELNEILNFEDEGHLKIIAPDSVMIAEPHYHLSLNGLMELLERERKQTD